MRPSHFLPLLLSASSALAFKGTTPFLIGSTRHTRAIDDFVSDGIVPYSSLSPLIEDVCDLGAVVVIDQPGLHASDLSKRLHLLRVLAEPHVYRSSASVPYVQGADADDFVQRIADLCGSRVVDAGELEQAVEGEKYVVRVHAEADLEGLPPKERKAAVADELLEVYRTTLPPLLSLFPGSHALLLTSSSAPSSPPSSLSSPTANPQRKEGGLLTRYQLLTPSLISALLLAFGVFVPVLLLVVHALAAIRAPARFVKEKQQVGGEKKNK